MSIDKKFYQVVILFHMLKDQYIMDKHGLSI